MSATTLNGHVAADTPLQALTPMDLEKFEFPPVEFVIEDLAPAGSLGLWVGRPKVGKSLLLIDAVASVAAGETFLDLATAQGPALYVPAEDALWLVRSRLFTRLGHERAVPVHVVPVDGSLDQVLRLDDAASFSRFAATIKSLRPSLVVLDPLRELHRRKENDADEMAALLRPLRQLAHESGAAIVLVHHRNKHATDPALATRGSSAIAGSVDLIVTIDSSGDDDSPLTPDQVLTLSIEGRFGPRQRLGARLRAGLRWEATDPRERDVINAEERIARLLEATGERLTTDEIAAALSLPAKTVQNATPRLYKARKLARTGSGRRGDPFRYAAPQMPFGGKLGE